MKARISLTLFSTDTTLQRRKTSGFNSTSNNEKSPLELLHAVMIDEQNLGWLNF